MTVSGRGWLCLVLGVLGATARPLLADSVPFWGAKDSVTIDTPIDRLKKGEFLWMGEAVIAGPVVMIVHAGGLPGYPESHGCIHLPSEFAQRLFEISPSGMTVVIGTEATAPERVAHPGYLAPVVLTESASSVPDPYVPDPTKFSWLRIGVAGHIGEQGTQVDPMAVARLQIPADFAAKVNGILTPGATLIVTNEALYPQTTGHLLQVVDADPPSERRPVNSRGS